MDDIIYLLNVTISGIKNIEKEIRLDFYKKTIDRDFAPDKYRIKAVYGENGSGKSAIITAIKIYQDLLIRENYLNESGTQSFLEEIVNKKTKSFKFDCEFFVNVNSVKLVYHHSINLGKNESGLYEIKQEQLEVKNGNYPNNNYKTVFATQDGELVSVICQGEERDLLFKKSLNLLATHTMLYIYMASATKEYFGAARSTEMKELTVHMLSCLCLALFLTVYLEEEDQHELYFLQKRLRESGLDKQMIGERLFDYGEAVDVFSNVNQKNVEKRYYDKYEKKVSDLTRFIQIFKSDLQSIDIDKKENGDHYVCELILNYGEYKINKEFESTGIKKLIRLFDCFTMANGNGIVFIDEMDSNLNDVYLCKLIEYFMYYGKGQLCFTTHNLDPMSVLKENKNSIDFLSSDNHLIQWTSRGNATPENCYRNGMIEDLPFNIEAADFIGMFGE